MHCKLQRALVTINCINRCVFAAFINGTDWAGFTYTKFRQSQSQLSRFEFCCFQVYGTYLNFGMNCTVRSDSMFINCELREAIAVSELLTRKFALVNKDKTGSVRRT